MADNERTLRGDLTRTILIWAGITFASIIVAFALSYRQLSDYMIARDARYRLEYQAAEFGRHLAAGQMQDIREESESLTSTKSIAGIVLLGTDGRLLFSDFDRQLMPDLNIDPASKLAMIRKLLETHPNLLVFKKGITGNHAVLWLVMDRRPTVTALIVSTAGVLSVMILLTAIAIFSLYRTLRKRMVAPVEKIQHLLDRKEPITDSALQTLESSLPGEAAAILHVYERLKLNHEDLNYRFSQMLDIVPACLWWADGNLCYRQLSKRSLGLFGAEPQQLVDKPLWSWMSDQDQAEANRERFEHAVRSRARHLNLAYPDILPDAQPRWFGEQLTIQYDTGGGILGLYGICNDITERHQQEHTIQTHVEQARRMETVGTLVGGIAHEFNNMLAGIVGNIFLLRQSVDPNPKAIERLDRVDNLIRRASGMIEQLLAFARKSQAQRGKFALKAHLEDILRILEPQLKSNAKIVADLRSDASVLADRTQIQQAITHLIDNADRALRGVSEPTITVTMEEFEADSAFLDRHPEAASQHLLHLTMADNGCGIEPDVLDHIFEPFFTTREVGEGTGLGLSMVYGMIRHLGGCIDAESSPGKGTRFHLYLPRAEAVSIEKDASGEICYGEGEAILLVEDEAVMRKVAVEVLEKLGYRVIEAIDGPDALRRFEEHRQDIRLLMADLIMPIMGGAKVASNIRKKEPDMPVLFMTAHDLTDSIGPELSFPHSDLISKPFPIATLSATLRRLINTKPSP